MTGAAYLQFGDSGNLPMSTQRVAMRETSTPHKGQTVDGYGAALPTPYLVRLNGRWRRVRAAQWGNASTLYVGRPGAWECVVSHIERD